MNDKQMLENQKVIMKALSEIDEVSHKTYDNIKMRISETDEILNPKEDVPSEDSLDNCKNKILIVDKYYECGSVCEGDLIFCDKCVSGK